MKIKFWQFEYDFDKDDAKVVIPLILLALGLAMTPLSKTALLAGAAAYYLLYFFLKSALLALKALFSSLHVWLFFKCAWCGSRKIFLQGYQGYHSDEFYGFHFCNECHRTSVLIRSRLIKATRVPEKEITDPDKKEMSF